MKEIEATIAEIEVILKEAGETLGKIQREVGGGGVRSSGEDTGEDALALERKGRRLLY